MDKYSALLRPKVLLNLLVFLVVIASGIDRVYWINSGPGYSWYSAKTVPAQFDKCIGTATEAKRIAQHVEYRCSVIGESMPFWPFYHSGKVPASIEVNP